jgi:hypothetical protein
MQHLEFGSAFSKVFDLFGKYAGPLLIWAAAVQLIMSLLVAVFITVILGGGGVGAALLGAAVLAGFGVVSGAGLTGAYVIGLHEAETTGSFPAFGEVWPRVSPRLGGLIITSIIAGIGIALGMILLIVPGLILLTWWAVFAPVVMLEDTSGTEALGRSRSIVSGNGWTVFGLIVVVYLITGIASNIIDKVVGGIFGGSDEFLGAFAGNFVSGTLVAPIGALLAIVIYEALVTGSGPGQDVNPAAGWTPPPGQVPNPPAPGQMPPPPTTPPQTPPDSGGHSGPFV